VWTTDLKSLTLAFIALLAATLFLVGLFVQRSEAQPCFAIDEMQSHLAENWGESIVFSGAERWGETVVLFLSGDGGWTLVAVDEAGMACLIGVGSNGRMPDGPVVLPGSFGDPA